MTDFAVRHLTVQYGGTAEPAVRDVTLDFEQGKVRAVVGESGSGKTTMGLALLGLLPGSAEVSGTVDFRGAGGLLGSTGISGSNGAFKARYIPQDPIASLNPNRRIGSQMAETLKVDGVTGKRARRELSMATLRDVGIPDPDTCLKLYPHELSGGMAQRVIIAEALLSHPGLLVADEPTSSLDATISIAILDLLRRMTVERDIALLLITHNIGHALAIGDAISVMYLGRLVETGPAWPVLSSPRMRYTEALLAARPVIANGRAALPVIPGLAQLRSADRDACVFVRRCAHADELCRAEPEVTVEGTESGEREYRCWHPVQHAEGGQRS